MRKEASAHRHSRAAFGRNHRCCFASPLPKSLDFGFLATVAAATRDYDLLITRSRRRDRNHLAAAGVVEQRAID